MGLVLGGPKAHYGVLLHRTVYYNPTSSKHLVFSVAAIPEQLQGQMSVLRYFASYMEQHLMKVGVSCLLGAWVWLCVCWRQHSHVWDQWLNADSSL